MKKIKLTQNKYALVDDEDFELLNSVKWFAHKAQRRDVFYAVRNSGKVNGKKTAIYMHRFLMNTPKGMETDHINGDGLDNRRSNLRVVTPVQNHMNSKGIKDTSSKLKGVTFNKRCNRWQSVIGFQGNKMKRNNIYIGLFESEEEAGRAYDRKARELYGEYAKLNFA